MHFVKCKYYILIEHFTTGIIESISIIKYLYYTLLIIQIIVLYYIKVLREESLVSRLRENGDIE